MYETFSEKSPNAATRATIQAANDILEEYVADGYTLTLRQLYYQFVSRNLIENTEKEYKRLSSVVTTGRMIGQISWEAIEDRGRSSVEPYVQPNMHRVLKGIEHHLAHDHWADQEFYVEVWVEKDALINVIERPANKYMVNHMACRGYMSASAAWAAGKRFEEADHAGKTCILLHLGDHDPSGIDMTRDNGERSELFSRAYIDVRRLALNMDQVQAYKPPPNPAKITDSRADDYIRRFGKTCWELDALRPQVISDLITSEIESFIDFDKWNVIAERQREERKVLRAVDSNSAKVFDFVQSLITPDEDTET